MTQKELIKKLQGLKAIEPNEEFVRTSRYVVLSSKAGFGLGQTIRQNAFSRGLSFVLSVALTAIFLLVLALGNTTGSFKTLFLPTLPGVNNESLISEADTITQDIDIHLDEIEYFEQARLAVALAGESEVELEASFLDGEDEIDKLLEEIIKY